MTNRLRTVVIATSTVLVALLLMGAMLGNSSSNNDGAYRQLAVYTEVLSRIKSDYVEEPDLKNVTLGALNGLLESIDPFASYLNADQYKEYLKTNDTATGNVGLVLSKRFGALTVVDSIPGSPAAKAGITTNDMIESIRGIGTRDMPLAYANLLLQGKPGTTIEISLLSMRHPEPKKLTLSRVEVQYPKVASKMLPDNLGYIQVEAMMPGTASQIASAVKTLERGGARKLLLDLRHSSVGPPEEGIAVANLFQDKGLITYLQGQRVPRQNFEADPAKAITKLPVVVLTNRGTALGAEIAAAALLEAKRADVVGERTYGDASVRKAINMDDGGAIILSVAKYYSPGGKAVQDTGVTPTVQVVESEPPQELEDESAPQEAAPQPAARPDEDTILKKAIEVATKGASAAQSEAPNAPQQPPATVTPQNMNVPSPEPRK
jgi:carboxyl-terminal processing protease